MNLKVNEKYRKLNLFYLIMIWIFCCFPLFSQTDLNNQLYKSRYNNDLYEIGKIVFKGNSSIDYDQLNKIINSKATIRSIPNRFVEYFQYNLKSNSYAPDYYINEFDRVISTMSDEIKFFDETKVKNDANTISIFYNQNGYHDVEVRYSFLADTVLKKNILTFYIRENSPYKVKTLEYIGLEGLGKDLQNIIESKKILKDNDVFNEYILINDITTIHRVLLDNGYFYAQYEVPEIYIDSLNKADSILVNFRTGLRQKINGITFIDSTNNQHKITDDMKRELLELHSGEWFSLTKKRQSEENLMNLGTFEITKIDTSSRFFPKSDTTLSFVIFNQYKKQQEYGVGLFLNTSPSSSFLNYGFDVSYSHKNFGGIGQEFNPFARFLFKSGSFSNLSPIDYEYQVGINFTQQLIFTIDKARIGAGTQFLYSYRTLDKYLKLSTITLPIRFPFKIMVPTTYYRNGNIEFSFERQIPINYGDAIKQAYSKGDAARIDEIYRNYKNLDKFVNDYQPILTSNIIGGSIFGDTRDNPFSPQKGYFSGLFLDGTNILFSLFDNNKISGASKYARLQLTNYWFWSTSKNAVIALKERLGIIYWYDKNYSYVPYERQFFAGGANSVRGWSSRRLRYIPQSNYLFPTTIENFAYDYVGNGTLIEASLEFRYRTGRISALGGAISDALENSGFVLFIDIGNAFQWMIVDSTGNYVYQNEWYEYITGLAVATGLGLRYETPVGPMRLDIAFPMYDPNLATAQFLPARSNFFKNFQFHIALGHAF